MEEKAKISDVVTWALISLILRMLLLVRYTLRFQNDFVYKKPCVAVGLHDEMIPALHFMRGTDTVCLSSRQHMGMVTAKILQSWGYTSVYGSEGRSGKRAYMDLVRALRSGKVVMISGDGPLGPRHRLKTGAVALARSANVPLYLVTAIYDGWKVNGSWDKFRFPKPFTRVEFKWIEFDLSVYPKDTPIEEINADAERALKTICNDPDEY